MSKFFKDGNFFPIPKAEYYVLSNDTFMSNMGPAEGKTNVCVVPCKNYAQATWVMKYAKSRGDQKYVRIRTMMPRTRSGVLYSLVPGWVDRAYEV
jgi:hypothetical protein